MKSFFFARCVPLVLLLSACTPPHATPPASPPLKVVTLDQTTKIVTGQTIYVPIYSQIYMWDQHRTMDLTATLSIRNTDLTHPIIVAAVNYYDSRGQQVRKYLEQPVELGPLSSTNFVVDQQDSSGGAGSAFIVEWIAQKQVTNPVVESVMINTSGNQGLSFMSQGRVIKQHPPGKGT